ncbi:chloride channel protein EriC [Endozoicomonas sp. OPT23]|uniref:chloride channel protein n=1 Tax=Endozoicomonas sp. OPT23 TaxID=2072845 RepID=UPI00129B9711|nr:chloride channel protein [Endozoicomonas sp. OPT23]MRI33456.1 chloride channel protein EriC [Endozoicomonas sp. OPT23]
MPAQRRRFSLHNLRIQLSEADALPHLTFLGLLTGFLGGCLLIGFNELLKLATVVLMPAGEDRFESLSDIQRFFLPVAGSLLILSMITLCRPNRRSVGVAHVIQRLALNRGRLPASSMALQFFTALTALASGFSVGREGPAVHIGAAAGSQLGQKLKLPDNTLTTLAGCGVATAISVSFNTPLAGVVFAMEVIVRRYNLVSFIPVMAASVIASLMTQYFYGFEPAFVIPPIHMNSMAEFLLAALMAVAIGLLAASFIKLQTGIATARKGRLAMPVLSAGFIMGITGVFAPDLMGMGYDTISDLLNESSYTLSFLLLMLFGKMLLTPMMTGLGIPGGIIGPTLFIGAVTGSVFSILGDTMLGIPNINGSFQALLGMVAMMAATLQAPLVALVTVLELTRNPNVIMPAMFVIVIACLISGRFFNNRGIFDQQLIVGGLSFDPSPLHQTLSQTGVASLMSSSFARCRLIPNPEEMQRLKYKNIEWLLYPDSNDILISSTHTTIEPEASRPVQIQATLYEALDQMNRQSLDALPVVSLEKSGRRICGVITRRDVESYYLDKLHLPDSELEKRV